MFRRYGIAFAALSLTAIGLSAQDVWKVGAPRLIIPGLNDAGSVLFENPAIGMRVSSGQVVLVDKGSVSIRTFSAAGTPLGSFGRQGSGPGEFPLIAVAATCGNDSLVVWSPSRTSLIGPDGKVAREIRIPSGGAPTIGATLQCSPAGSFAYLSNPSYNPTVVPGVFRTKVIIARTNSRGDIVWRSDSISEGERINARPGGYFRPLGSNLLFAFAGELLAFGSSDSARVWLIDSTGQRSKVAWKATRRAPTAAEYEAAVKREAGNASPAFQARVAQAMRGMPAPELSPVFFGLYGDPAGRLWVQTSSPGAGRTDFRIFDQRGKPVAVLSLPKEIAVYQIGADFVLGLYSNERDEPQIVLYPLLR